MVRFLFPLLTASTLFSGTLSVFTAAAVDNPPATFCALPNDNCVGSASIPNTRMVLEYETFGNADYGVLRSSSSVAISGTLEGTPPRIALANAFAQFRDNVKFTSLAPLPLGTPTTAMYSFAVTGFRTPTTVNSIAIAQFSYKNYST